MDHIVKLWWTNRDKSAKTGRGVRQGGCLSLILFNLYSDTLPRKPLKGLETSQQEDK